MQPKTAHALRLRLAFVLAAASWAGGMGCAQNNLLTKAGSGEWLASESTVDSPGFVAGKDGTSSADPAASSSIGFVDGQPPAPASARQQASKISVVQPSPVQPAGAVQLTQRRQPSGKGKELFPNMRAGWDEPAEDDPLAEPKELEEPPPAANKPAPSDIRRRMPVGQDYADQIRLTHNNDRITLTVRDAPMSAVLALIAEQHGLNIVAGDDLDQRISVTISDVMLEDALNTILSVHGLTWVQQKDIIIVSPVSEDKKGFPGVQGRMVRVYPLNYVAAQDVDKIVVGLLSPVGQSFVVQSSNTDQRRTREQLVVEDLPDYLARIDEYIAQADCRPRQVMVEAHVLQVTLKDNTRHGINFDQLLRAAGANVHMGTAGLASAAASPAGLITVSGADLDAVIECIKSTTDAKTLASPKVAVLNGQEASIQIGGKLGYLLTTTVQTTSMQSVNFLDFGVILKVTPIITADNKVLLSVKPQVSTARLNPTNNLPESETTELDTKVMLCDGQAIVIGGLIKETNNDAQNKVLFLGDLWGIGALFKRRETLRQRDEIIITLLPKITPDGPEYCPAEIESIQQAHTPLMHGPLVPNDRRMWEPDLPTNNRLRLKKYERNRPLIDTFEFGPDNG
ncbi:MAG: hypothetical protein AB7O62_10795, partial [Pirellulales bacterium]